MSLCSRIRTVLVLVVSILGLTVSSSAQTFTIGSTSIRPFVTSIIPVVGRNGAVGGVVINAGGVIRRATEEDADELRAEWLASRSAPKDAFRSTGSLRKISLRRLHAAILEHARSKTPLPEEILFLAGLQQVEYLFVYPDDQDLVLAGRADAWEFSSDGGMVGATNGAPILRLDDLAVALRVSESAARGGPISCSIDPTEEGLVRLQRFLTNPSLVFNRQTIRELEATAGEQEITVEGIPDNSHFARILVAADYLMKQLAMGFEKSPVKGLDSYLDLLSRSSKRFSGVSAPRWWLAVNYDPLGKSKDGLAWQLRGPGVRVLTEDGHLDGSGSLVNAGQPARIAQAWADAMTKQYPALTRELNAFAQLKNCMDLTVVGALIANQDLLNVARCELPLLQSRKIMQLPKYNVPKSIESRASLVKGRQGWLVSISGGVDIDARSVLAAQKVDRRVTVAREKATAGRTDHWWWE